MPFPGHWTERPQSGLQVALARSGTVYEAQISKAHIHAVFLNRGESEVIVDPKHLIDIAPVQEQAQGLEMKF